MEFHNVVCLCSAAAVILLPTIRMILFSNGFKSGCIVRRAADTIFINSVSRLLLGLRRPPIRNRGLEIGYSAEWIVGIPDGFRRIYFRNAFPLGVRVAGREAEFLGQIGGPTGEPFEAAGTKADVACPIRHEIAPTIFGGVLSRAHTRQLTTWLISL